VWAAHNGDYFDYPILKRIVAEAEGPAVSEGIVWPSIS